MKRLIATSLLVLIIANLISCGTKTTETQMESENPYQEDNELSQNEENTIETENDAPELPDIDMTGDEFTILTCGWFSYAPLAITDISPEEETGERLNDAAYRRAGYITDKYGCTLNWAMYGDHMEGLDVLNRSVAAGDAEFDLALIRGRQFYQEITSDILLPLEEVPYINLDAPYYDAASLAITTLKEKTYGVVSDISTIRYQSAACVFANIDLIKEYNLEDIYDIVRDGRWTYDKMFEMGRVHGADVDNNGIYDREDRFTVTYINSSTVAFMIGAGVDFAVPSEDGIELTFYNENNIDGMMKVTEYFTDPNLSYYYHHRSTDSADEHNMFMQRHSMFHVGGIYHGSLFREMEDDFAIIPIPKLYEEQRNYRTAIFNDNITLTTIPITNNKLDKTGVLLEELCYYGKKDLYPEMYEKVLKDKIARDQNSQDMIDMIFANTAYDVGLFYFPSLQDVVTGRFRLYDQTYASEFASKRRSIETALEELMSAID